MNKLAIIVIAAGLLACGGKKKDEAAGSGSAPAAGSGSAMMAGSGSAAMAGSGSAMMGSGSAAAGSGSSAKADVPTEQDFEQQAAKDIDDKNVEAKVGEIEKQIGQ